MLKINECIFILLFHVRLPIVHIPDSVFYVELGGGGFTNVSTSCFLLARVFKLVTSLILKNFATPHGFFLVPRVC